MKPGKSTLSGILVVSATLFCISQASPEAGAATARIESFAQADRTSFPARIKGWTRAQWNAAVKRWAKDREKFAACVQKLNENPEAKRLSYHNQTHLIEKCMQEKP